jgi:heat-inducible transcriptional repressor
MLTPRQEIILRKVVESYAATGQPVASKTLAADPTVGGGPSTIRYELASLEACGLLATWSTACSPHPSSAARSPGST